jgi:hypothetical protein
MASVKQFPYGPRWELFYTDIFSALGIALFWFAATELLPSEADLTEVRGTLQSYSCHGKAPECDLTLEDGSTPWTDALSQSQAGLLFEGKWKFELGPSPTRGRATDFRSMGGRSGRIDTPFAKTGSS